MLHERLRLPRSLPHPYPRLSDMDLHHINGLDQIVVAEREIETLEGFLLVSVAQDRIGHISANPSAHRIRQLTVA